MTIIIVALSITALFVITALVIDLSVVRQNRQVDKSASDFAVAAGIRGMDDGSGQIDSWGGICTALDYLKANRPEFNGLTAVDASDNPITPDPCAAPLTEYCENSPADWREWVGLADGGDVRVTIAGGYDLSASGFSEDADAYSGDEGDDPCEHLAIIIEQRQDPFFGGVAGSTGWETTMRSVARLDVGDDGLETAALVLLERTGCAALQIGGSNATVLVDGVGDTPGIIHSDSLGTGSDCNSSNNIFDVNGSGLVQIVTGRAQTPAGSEAPGIITARALHDPAGSSSFVSSPSPDQVCAEIAAGDCVDVPAGVSGGGPTGNVLVGRGVADVRYRTRLIEIRDEAATRLGWTEAQAQAAGFATPACGAATYTDERVWLNCGINSGTTFTSAVKEVVITGNVSIGGPNILQFDGATSPVEADAPTKVYIGGNVSLSSGSAALRINDNSAATCLARHTAAPTAKNIVVVAGTGINHTGGLFRMCQSTLLMTHTGGALPCPIPSTNGVAPYPNSCSGSISSGGGSIRDWSAPNVNNTTAPTPAQLQNLEDLAFWTETESGLSITGNNISVLTLSGIFVAPNANPFTIAGNGTQHTEDAQFLTRRLTVAGEAQLTMTPQPHNALQIPVLGGYTLIR